MFAYTGTRLPKTEEVLKIEKFSWMDFRIMIQTALIKRFGRSADKRIEENSDDAFRYYLYSVADKYFKDKYGHGEMIWTK